jgi:hypothetical protein
LKAFYSENPMMRIKSNNKNKFKQYYQRAMKKKTHLMALKALMENYAFISSAEGLL